MLFTLLACATLSSPEEAVSAASPPDPQPQAVDPSPPERRDPHFSPQEIRAGMPVGLTLVYRSTVAGSEPAAIQWEVRSADDAQVQIAYTPVQEGGAALGPSEIKVHRWDELAQHSAFVSAWTTVEDNVAVTTPAGDFVCTRYSVQDPSGERAVYDFAPEQPGPPVRVQITAAGQDKMEMLLLSRSLPRQTGPGAQ